MANPAPNKPAPNQNIYGQKPQKPPNVKSSGKVGRPKAPLGSSIPRKFKTMATGETRNSPMTTPNIIFMLGLFLIIAAGFKSARFKTLWNDIWNKPAAQQSPGQIGSSASDLLNQFRIIGLQLVWLFAMTVIARAVPPISRLFLIVIAGMWLLFLINNPQVLQWLNAQEQAATGTSSTTNESNNTTMVSATTASVNPLTATQLQQIQQNLQNLIQKNSGGN
jgi:hypothetical protein